MEMKVCPKGHYYNGDVNSTCPVCAAENNRGGKAMIDEIGATRPVTGANGVEDIGPTQPADSSYYTGNSGPIMGGETQWPGGETKPPTQPFADGSETQNFFDSTRGGVDTYSEETQAVTPGNLKTTFMPSVGWLVCIDGPDRGRDYRIHSGYNNIGRSNNMDICIEGDLNISREKDALIAYDDQEKTFFFAPSEGTNVIRLNNKLVMSAAEIKAYDVLTIGSSKLLFIPLCGEKFSWGD